MKIYAVGGAIRDALLGLPTKDIDYVVVGASPEQMMNLGFKPVGQDFPVFLHPHTSEEYALARTERKTGPGYKGFVFHTEPHITLEEDLVRRDLTINAMAQAVNADGLLEGPVIDPCGGQADLAHKIFRHIGPAFTEDPLRLLRVARFAARFSDFSLAPETLALLQEISRSGELQALVKERVWQEIARGLMEDKPSRMFQVLHDSHALDAVFGALEHLDQIMRDLDNAASAKMSLAQRFALIYRQVKQNDVDLALEHMASSAECHDYAKCLNKLEHKMGHVLTPEYALELYDMVDAWRKPQRFMDLLDIMKMLGKPVAQYVDLLKALQQIDTQAVSEQAKQTYQNDSEFSQGEWIGQCIRRERLKMIAQLI